MKLLNQHKVILFYIRKYFRDNECAPTIDDISNFMDDNTNETYSQVKQLIDDGFIEIKLTQKAYDYMIECVKH